MTDELPPNPLAPPPAGAPAALQDGPSLPAAVAERPVGSMVQEPEAEIDRQVSHHEPILTGGATGDAVERLVKLLAAVGYATNTLVKGENAGRVLDNTIMADVQRFWRDHEDAGEPERLVSGQDVASSQIIGNWIGPHTWQKLYELARGLETAAS